MSHNALPISFARNNLELKPVTHWMDITHQPLAPFLCTKGNLWLLHRTNSPSYQFYLQHQVYTVFNDPAPTRVIPPKPLQLPNALSNLQCLCTKTLTLNSSVNKIYMNVSLAFIGINYMTGSDMVGYLVANL